MTFEENKESAYKFLSERQGIPFNDFAELLNDRFGETIDYWNQIRDDLIAENRIAFGIGCHASLKQPPTLLFTDSHPTKCVET